MVPGEEEQTPRWKLWAGGPMVEDNELRLGHPALESVSLINVRTARRVEPGA